MNAAISIRVCPASDYEMGEGFVVEQRRYWGIGSSEERWAIPAWDEIGLAHLDGVFATRAAAEAAVEEFA